MRREEKAFHLMNNGLDFYKIIEINGHHMGPYEHILSTNFVKKLINLSTIIYKKEYIEKRSFFSIFCYSIF